MLDGRVTTVSVSGSRTLRADALYAGPLESTVRHDEIAVEAFFPALVPGEGVAFEELARRHGDYALCGVAAVVRVAGGRVVAARAGYLSVAEVPTVVDLAAPLAEEVADSTLAAAAELALERLDPADDLHATADYRAQLVRVLTARALRTAYDDALRREAARAEERTAIRLVVNGVAHDLEVPARRLLSDALRHDLGLTGTHVGCEHGVCGACTVLVDGRPMRSCLLLAVSAVDTEITTVEGLARPDGSLGPVQQAFLECHGLQCGFCTPGFLTTITAGIRDTPAPTEDDAREMVAGNLCRCTGYTNIVRSVLRAAELAASTEGGEA